ncbi:unnamed protein product [Bemisia tabaci]|uniref:Uncharacterized protein n=1 Tax=Bemisia tabaci TaxID=7038 RepID=A0A9P0ALR2_BEMTA|nr:unnamed protein product [Bemisia tabaci]
MGSVHILILAGLFIIALCLENSPKHPSSPASGRHKKDHPAEGSHKHPLPPSGPSSPPPGVGEKSHKPQKFHQHRSAKLVLNEDHSKLQKGHTKGNHESSKGINPITPEEEVGDNFDMFNKKRKGEEEANMPQKRLRPDERRGYRPRQFTPEECKGVCMKAEGYILNDSGKHILVSVAEVDKQNNCKCGANKELLDFLKAKNLSTTDFLNVRSKHLSKGSTWLKDHGITVHGLAVNLE